MERCESCDRLRNNLVAYRNIILGMEERVYQAEMERDQVKSWLYRLEKLAVKNAAETQVTKFFKDMGIKY